MHTKPTTLPKKVMTWEITPYKHLLLQLPLWRYPIDQLWYLGDKKQDYIFTNTINRNKLITHFDHLGAYLSVSGPNARLIEPYYISYYLK